MAFRRYSEDHRQQIFRSGQSLPGNTHFVTGVKPQIESQGRLDGSDGAWQVFASFLRLKDGRIRIKDPDDFTWPGTLHDNLSFQARSGRQRKGEQKPSRLSSEPHHSVHRQRTQHLRFHGTGGTSGPKPVTYKMVLSAKFLKL